MRDLKQLPPKVVRLSPHNLLDRLLLAAKRRLPNVRIMCPNPPLALLRHLRPQQKVPRTRPRNQLSLRDLLLVKRLCLSLHETIDLCTR
jgi:hypothetical protein